MRVVSRRSRESPVGTVAPPHEFDHLFAIQSISMAHQIQCNETPIETAKPEVLAKPVFELVRFLSGKGAFSAFTKETRQGPRYQAIEYI